jgi:hypothetical protein
MVEAEQTRNKQLGEKNALMAWATRLAANSIGWFLR